MYDGRLDHMIVRPVLYLHVLNFPRAANCQNALAASMVVFLEALPVKSLDV